MKMPPSHDKQQRDALNRSGVVTPHDSFYTHYRGGSTTATAVDGIVNIRGTSQDDEVEVNERQTYSSLLHRANNHGDVDKSILTSVHLL